MPTIILSGVGGSTNWLPLIFSLVGIVIILKTSEFIIRYIKRRRLDHENKLINGISSSFEDGNGQKADSE